MAAGGDHQQSQAKRDQQHNAAAGQKDPSGAACSPRSVALGSKRGDTGAEIDDGQENNGIDPVGGSNGSHRLRAEPVHEVLEDQASQRTDTGLDHRRQAKVESLAQRCGRQHFPAGGKTQKRISADAVQDQEKGHGGLGYHSGNGGSGHMPPENRHQQDVQDYVGHRREKDCVEGRLAVADPPQSGGIYIIYSQERDPHKDDPQIVSRQRDGVFRGVQKGKEGQGEKDAKRGQHKEDAPKKQGEGG